MAFYSGNSTDRPRVIGHRGACGLFPEHTLASYESAIAAGADAIELDLIATRDGQLVALHDAELSRVTNVADFPQFLRRTTERIVDGQRLSGVFAMDLSLAELKLLRVRQRFAFRNSQYNDRWKIPTLAEVLDLWGAARFDKPDLGIYLEIKHADWHARNGLSMEELLWETLKPRGLVSKSCGVVVESFDAGVLRQLWNRLENPIVQLIDKPQQATASALREIKTYADGIGAWKRLVLPTRGQSIDEGDGSRCQLAEPTTLIADAHAMGLQVDVWTFRDEPQFLAEDYRNDPTAEVRQFRSLGADGLISDFPASALAALR